MFKNVSLNYKLRIESPFGSNILLYHQLHFTVYGEGPKPYGWPELFECCSISGVDVYELNNANSFDWLNGPLNFSNFANVASKDSTTMPTWSNRFASLADVSYSFVLEVIACPQYVEVEWSNEWSSNMHDHSYITATITGTTNCLRNVNPP